EPTENNWLLALVQDDGQWGLACTDISTGQFQCSQFAGSSEQVESIIASLNPTEIISDQKADSLGFQAATQVEGVNPEEINNARDLPRQHFLH
ncbi:MAG TPA: hypothetical protein DDY38_09610, partial [Firmicutes bacterium]|nr:hypothetical protein [Bacillota bacterium]